jgi:hypothetical protein
MDKLAGASRAEQLRDQSTVRIAATAAIGLVAVGLVAIAPHRADARPYRVTSIEPTVVQVLDIESIRERPSGTSTAVITEILRPGHNFHDPRALAHVSLFEFQCPSGQVRSLAVLSLAEDMTQIEWVNIPGSWADAGAGDEEAQKIVCGAQIDPKLNVEAPNEKALANAIRLAIP